MVDMGANETNMSNLKKTAGALQFIKKKKEIGLQPRDYKL
jgi:hypothetical protein